jgi:uncharacterized protein with PIN domain
MSGQENHTSPKKDETTDSEELLKKLWKALAHEGLAVVECAAGWPFYVKTTYTPLTSLDILLIEPISLGRIKYSEKQELGRCQQCGKPLLTKDIEEVYGVGILIDKSSDEPVAIFAIHERCETLDNQYKALGTVKYIIGLRPMKLKLGIMEDFSGWKNESLLMERIYKWKTEEAEPPVPSPETLTIIREYLQHLITELKEEEKTAEKEQLFRRCNEVLHMVEELMAEKITELEKKNHKIHEALYPILWEDEKAKLIIEKDMDHVIQILKEEYGLEKWLNPPKCENITQTSEYVKRETICMGTFLDFHIHLEYEAVKKDEGIVTTAIIRPIRMVDTIKQQ